MAATTPIQAHLVLLAFFAIAAKAKPQHSLFYFKRTNPVPSFPTKQMNNLLTNPRFFYVAND
ncbi:hypothetical protein [Terrimonas pollutisoli]|uniref:hypothetical protein n=1 Tax=Terrimonas pollutisoli TaxID=3034147 RepID=UPI0023ED56DE|nr:hypothetical protein [Terrimonas sp. H1YJ31]